MCLILFAWQQLPGLPLVVAANRDENHSRPTQAARFWNEYPNLLAGRDLLAGGTWLGLSRNGRFAAVTNYRDPSAPAGELSRGQLCTDYLAGSFSASEYLANLRAQRDQFSGFNLLVGDTSELWFYSNRNDQMTQLAPGIYGLSNGQLNCDWPKVTAGKQALRQQLDAAASSANLSAADLLEILADRNTVPDQHLPDTGVGTSVERLLAPRFIVSTEYGTRCSTVVLAGNPLELLERNFDAEGNCIGQQHYRFSRPSTH